MKIILVMAATLDGKIGRNATDPVNWTGKADKQYFVKITRKAGVMIMGHNTFTTIGSPLPGRQNIVMTRTLAGKTEQENLQFTDQSPEKIVKSLYRQGYRQAALIGGAQINTLFARKGLIHEIHLTVAPRIFGKGLSLFDGDLDLHLELMETRPLEKDALLLKYRVGNAIAVVPEGCNF